MKDFILDYLMKNISNYNTYSNSKLKEIKYGLETLYLTITKTIVIIILSIILNTYHNLFLLIIFYSLLRLFGSGLHATKSIYCWISSLLIFSLIPIIIDKIYISKKIMITISSICTILILFYSPSDTIKRPMNNKKKRLIDKIICTILSTIYTSYIIISNNYIYNNILLFSQIIETSLILPISYKLFNLRYNNYKYN
jgi:accessory gene regulator B